MGGSTHTKRGILIFLFLSSLLLCSGLFAQELTLTDDAYISAQEARKSSGDDEWLDIDGKSNTVGLLKFDLSVLSPGISPNAISKAVLRLWASRVQNPGTFSVYMVSGRWNESTVTFAGAPSIGAPVARHVAVTSDGDFIAVDITSAVQLWIASPDKNSGLALVADDAGTSVKFDSKENRETSHPASVAITPFGPPGPQ